MKELGADLAELNDEQIIAWYSRHPHPTVRALVLRLSFNNQQHQEAVLESYRKGLQDQKLNKSPYGLSDAEMAFAAKIGVSLV